MFGDWFGFGKKNEKKQSPWQRRIAPFGVCRLLISHLVGQTSRPAHTTIAPNEKSHQHIAKSYSRRKTLFNVKVVFYIQHFPWIWIWRQTSVFVWSVNFGASLQTYPAHNNKHSKWKSDPEKIQEIDKIELMISITKTYDSSAIKRGKHSDWKQR